MIHGQMMLDIAAGSITYTNFSSDSLPTCLGKMYQEEKREEEQGGTVRSREEQGGGAGRSREEAQGRLSMEIPTRFIHYLVTVTVRVCKN